MSEQLEKRCGKCGAPRTPGNRFCVACGAPTIGTVSVASSSTSGRFAITHVLPDGRSQRFRLDRQVVIGRQEADVAVSDDPFLSSRHSALREIAGRFVLSDLGSTNGTYIRIRGEVELRPGDQVMIGGQVFRFSV